jgi:hypothetical protein
MEQRAHYTQNHFIAFRFSFHPSFRNANVHPFVSLSKIGYAGTFLNTHTLTHLITLISLLISVYIHISINIRLYTSLLISAYIYIYTSSMWSLLLCAFLISSVRATCYACPSICLIPWFLNSIFSPSRVCRHMNIKSNCVNIVSL